MVSPRYLVKVFLILSIDQLPLFGRFSRSLMLGYNAIILLQIISLSESVKGPLSLMNLSILPVYALNVPLNESLGRLGNMPHP